MQNKQLGGLASGVSSNDIYKKSIKGDLDANKRLALVEPFRCQVEQMRYLQEQVRGYALGSDALDYAISTENNAIGTTDAEISNTKEGFTDLLNTIIAHNNLLKVNTNSSTSSAWVLEREAYMNDAPDAPDGENYSFGNIAFAIFGYDKTFTVISPYDVTEAVLAITLPAMDNVSGQIAVERPDGTGFVSLKQNKRYYFRTYFDGTTPKIVLENSEPVTTIATETVSGTAKISTTTQVNAGSDDLTFITPLKFKTKSDTLNTVQVIGNQVVYITKNHSGSVVKQQVDITYTINIIPGGSAVVTYAIPFSTAISSAQISVQSGTPDNGVAAPQLFIGFTTGLTQVTIINKDGDTTINACRLSITGY